MVVTCVFASGVVGIVDTIMTSAWTLRGGRRWACGNIGLLLKEVGTCGGFPEPAFGGSGEDSGNGSLMRFAPMVTSGAKLSFPELHDVARRSSYTTQPG